MHFSDSIIGQRIVDADALRDGQRFDDALVAYQAIIDDAPDYPEAHFKLGTLYGRIEKSTDAERCYRAALDLYPRYPEANNNLGLIHLIRGDFDAAEWCFRTALAERPGYVDAHLNLAGLMHEMTRLLEAEYFSRRVLELDPKSSKGYARLAQSMRANGDMAKAIDHYERAVALDTNSVSALTDLASCYWNLGRHGDAERELKKALAILPEFIPAWNNLLLISNYRLGDRGEVRDLHKAFGALVRQRCGDLPISRPESRLNAERRLRIGFMSGDFRRHSVAYFVRGALEHLDRQQFELYAYYGFRTEDTVTWQIKPQFHVWRKIFGLPDQEVTGLIAEDGIDILIDLSGHTAAARPLVLGRKPAPIQVHWIGYPNTIGLDCVDYRLTDAWADPPESGEEFSCEKLWRLAPSFLCYSPSDTAPEVQPPPSVKRQRISFGSFNSRAKLSEECLSLWVDVLNAVPDSRLVLKSMFGTGDEVGRASLKQLFVDRGIAPDRIEVLLPRSAVEDHLAAYHDIDIALDTFPYNGTTTTCEALWMGVPVVTLAGDRHVARVGVSILNNIGLGDLVASDRDDFVATAVALVETPGLLAEVRRTMRERMRASALMDRRAMAATFGNALRQMWRIHCDKFSQTHGAETTVDEQDATPLRLHIGGRAAKEGWKILDSDPRPEVDYVGNISDLSMFAENSFTEIYCSHVLEHVGQTEMLKTLGGIYRILRSGGRLYLSVPDLDVLVWLFSNPAYGPAQRFQVMRMMFGGQVDEHDFHRIGLTFDFLNDYLRDVGFSSIEHVESLGLFADTSDLRFDGHSVSLNLVVTK